MANAVDNRETLNITEQETIAKALILLLKQNPIFSGKTAYNMQEIKDNGLGLFPLQGTVYEKRFLDNSFYAIYAFAIRYRIALKSDEQKVKEQDKLSLLAQWLEGKVITVNNTQYQLTEYPALTDNRTIREIMRTSDVYLADAFDDGSCDYQIQMRLRYFRKGNILDR